MKKIIILYGPSQEGKSTLVRKILESSLSAKVGTILSTTTRPPRGTPDDEVYRFLTREEFERKATQGDFVEVDEHGGNLYGYERNGIEAALKKQHVLCTATESGIIKLQRAGYDVVPIRIKARFHRHQQEKFYQKHKGRKEDDAKRARIPIQYKKEILNSFKKGGLERATEELAHYIKSVIER